MMTEPTVPPEAARVDLDAVRELLAEVRGTRRRGELERCRLLVRTLQAANTDLIQQLDEMTAEAERLCGARQATVQAIEDGIAALDIERLAAYDIERVARVVGAAFRIEEVERLRGLVARYARHVEICEGTDFLDYDPTQEDGGAAPEDRAELQRIRREAGLS